jgi:hypothetical protein
MVEAKERWTFKGDLRPCLSFLSADAHLPVPARNCTCIAGLGRAGTSTKHCACLDLNMDAMMPQTPQPGTAQEPHDARVQAIFPPNLMHNTVCGSTVLCSSPPAGSGTDRILDPTESIRLHPHALLHRLRTDSRYPRFREPLGVRSLSGEYSNGGDACFWTAMYALSLPAVFSSHFGRSADPDSFLVPISPYLTLIPC